MAFFPELVTSPTLPTLVLQIPKSKANEATKIAIDVGFRHIDAAYFYQNEEEVGQALRDKMADGTVKREDLFYTTKVSTCGQNGWKSLSTQICSWGK